MQIEEVNPEQRVEGFVRTFDPADWRDPDLNLYLTLTRATDAAPPEQEKPPWINPYDDPYPLYRKVPKERPKTPPPIKLQHQVVEALPSKDPRPIKTMVRDVLRTFREHPQYMKMGHVREYQEALACFQLRCAVVQWPDKHVPKMSEAEYAAMVELAAKHLTLVDCPAQETVQLQITTQAAFHFAMKELDRDNNERRAELDSMVKSIIDTKVIDIRKYYETAEVLRERVLYYLFLYNKFVDPLSSTTDGAVKEIKAELEVALESVFPRKGFLYWMDLPPGEKEVQLQELAEVVTGVRVFNKYEGKGGHYFQLPHEVYEQDALDLGQQIHDTLEKINEKIHAYSLCITKYHQDMGVYHTFIKRLRDEIAFNFQDFARWQAGLYLEPIHKYLWIKQEAVSDMLEAGHQHLDRLLEIIGSYEVVPSDMVFPELRALGAIHIAIAQEFRYLQARIKAATPLLEMANSPFYRESPHTEKRLDAKQKNFLFLPCDPPKEDIYRYEVTRDECKAAFIKPDKVDEVLSKQPQIEYNGFCPVCFVRNNGILWKGDPYMGLVQTADKKLYCFGDEDSQTRFLKAPCKYIVDVAKLVLQMPQHVHLLNLQGTPAFLYLSIPKVCFLSPTESYVLT
ncbi:hypothetical protein M758_3G166700 [Ceratodon purpureus]|nr:hypothetical protein M758_3G166700 [Ceratodon purpureus]